MSRLGRALLAQLPDGFHSRNLCRYEQRKNRLKEELIMRFEHAIEEERQHPCDPQMDVVDKVGEVYGICGKVAQLDVSRRGDSPFAGDQNDRHAPVGSRALLLLPIGGRTKKQGVQDSKGRAQTADRKRKFTKAMWEKWWKEREETEDTLKLRQGIQEIRKKLCIYDVFATKYLKTMWDENE